MQVLIMRGIDQLVGGRCKKNSVFQTVGGFFITLIWRRNNVSIIRRRAKEV